jgi:hypothetical protein
MLHLRLLYTEMCRRVKTLFGRNKNLCNWPRAFRLAKVDRRVTSRAVSKVFDEACDPWSNSSQRPAGVRLTGVGPSHWRRRVVVIAFPFGMMFALA